MSDTNELNLVTQLEAIELDMFRGRTSRERTARIFGGLVIGQALTAAYQTLDGRVCNSLHAYFIRPGDPKIPILYQVERARDGGSFSIRRVIAIQNGRQILNLAASFQVPEQGFEHQLDMPAAPAPEDLPSDVELRERAGQALESDWIWPIEIRPVNWREPGDKTPAAPAYTFWFRAITPFRDDIAGHQAVLAYASDLGLMDSSMRPHGVAWNSGRIQSASLDHALWFHRPSDLREWHLYVQESPSASGGRGFNRASIFTRDGAMIASATQEALIRWR
jgi:acyl-CoA thioesterase-2